ncbi:uncharacterized protein LOC136068689 [Quercus suber]|uniref:uncharacterized protein LOC136068689 n=1 Tax=Quercus suber TaxID=58331 RepID=UPI0032DEE0F0
MEDSVKKIKIIEPIIPIKKIKTIKPVTPAKNIVSILIESISASITIHVKSVYDSIPIESVFVKFVENSFHYNMIFDSAYLLALNVFISEIGYDQIKMAPEDMEKPSFITPWETYCYKVMPFGLKNTGATFQHAATTLLHDLIHKEVEVYVDDMIVKSKDREWHIPAL